MAGPALIVHRYVDAFNRKDSLDLAKCFAPLGFIIDETPPHVWSGPLATREWLDAIIGSKEYASYSEIKITLGTLYYRPSTPTAIYCTVAATMDYVLQGQRRIEAGSICSVVLHKIEQQWLIAAWAWARGLSNAI